MFITINFLQALGPWPVMVQLTPHHCQRETDLNNIGLKVLDVNKNMIINWVDTPTSNSAYGFHEVQYPSGWVPDFKISVWRTIHDFHVLRFIFKIIYAMKCFHRNYFFPLITAALTTVLWSLTYTTTRYRT